MLLERVFANVAAALLARCFQRALRAPVVSDLTHHLDPSVTLEHDVDVAFWTRRFGVSKQQLKAAVARVGTRASLIEHYLETRGRYELG